jgi:hypothetical protein
VPVRLWTVPFQDAVVVLLQSRDQRFEVLWVRTNESETLNRDLPLWAINHNNLLEDVSEFRAPGYLHGDPTLGLPPLLLLVAATEGRTDIAGANTATASIVLRQRDVLVFDQVKQPVSKVTPKHCRELLSDEVWEVHANVVASCYVLDAFLLCACDDGVLRAHPRNNPHSIYHVEDVHSLVYQMTSLYNVVAMIHSVDVLEVRAVQRKSEDPFIHFSGVLFRASMVDANHAPLLYGPYVVYRSLQEGAWVRVAYDSAATDKRPELVKVPFHAGWSIVAIKSANWRYWTFALRNPRTDAVEDFFVFVGGSAIKPFLLAKCIECGADASHLCGTCEEVGFCAEHGGESKHPERCAVNVSFPLWLHSFAPPARSLVLVVVLAAVVAAPYGLALGPPGIQVKERRLPRWRRRWRKCRWQ